MLKIKHIEYIYSGSLKAVTTLKSSDNALRFFVCTRSGIALVSSGVFIFQILDYFDGIFQNWINIQTLPSECVTELTL